MHTHTCINTRTHTCTCTGLNTCVRDEEGVLKLGRAPAVLGDSCPVIRPGNVSPGRPEVDHRLHSESVAGPHDAHRLVLLVVGHIGRRVEERANAVPAVALCICTRTYVHVCMHACTYTDTGSPQRPVHLILP